MRRLTLIITLLLLMGISILAAINYDSDIFHPNTIMTCFKMESIGRFDGKIEFSKDNDIVFTNMASFNKLAEEYQIIDLRQAHEYVKDPNWNEEGRYLQCVYRVIIADDKQMDEAVEALSKDPNVLYAEFETINRSRLVPNDPLISQQYAIARMSCYDAWDYVTGSQDVIVGITDSGIKWNHPDLQDNMWINPFESEGVTINWASGTFTGTNNIDDDGNGKIDDVLGWDFHNNDNNPYQNYSDNDHGTHVAGCAGAVFNNNEGGSGSCPVVTIMACKGASNTEPMSTITGGYDQIKYCAENGATVINASWGGQTNSLSYANQVVNYATNLGALVVSSAGNNAIEHNSSYLDAPSDCPNALCVAATNQTDVITDFSDYGATIDVCAPGIGILSTVIAGNGYDSYQGTSMSSPLVAGVAALVKSVNPELTPAQLRQRLMDTCDWIYDVNPTYAQTSTSPAKLGAGRVNAFAATMYDKIPYLSIDDKEISELNGDGDGVPNPGELIRLDAQISNLINPYSGLTWTTANNVIAKLRCDMPGVIVVDSVASYGNLSSGASNWNTNDPLTFQTVSGLPSVPIPFKLFLTANPTGQYPYTATREFEINLSLIQPGWPKSLTSSSQSSANIFNIDGLPGKEIIFGDQSGLIHAMKSNGTEIAGFPYTATGGIVGALAIADVNGDGFHEIVANVSPNTIICLSHTGQLLWTQTVTGSLVGNPIITNLNMTGTEEIVAFTQGRYVVALNSDGSFYPNFPVLLDGILLAPGAVGDLNGDGQMDIVVATISGKLHAINSTNGGNVTGFPYTMASGSRNQPTICNLDSDAQPEILIPTSSNSKLYALNHDGSLLFQKDINQQVKSGAVVADVNNNGTKEIVLVTFTGDLYIMNTSGENLPGFPVNIGESVESTPVIARFDGSNLSGIIFGDVDGRIHSYRSDGTQSPNFPIGITGNITVSAALGDIDGDGDMDIVIPNEAAYYMIDLKRQAVSYQWQLWMNNNHRNGNIYQATPAEENTTPAPANALSANYPNPFNPVTTINYSIKTPSPVVIDIFNTKGQKVKTLVNDTRSQGEHSITWNGMDDNGTPVSGGVYFYRMKSENFTSTKKMILMK